MEGGLLMVIYNIACMWRRQREGFLKKFMLNRILMTKVTVFIIENFHA